MLVRLLTQSGIPSYSVKVWASLNREDINTPQEQRPTLRAGAFALDLATIVASLVEKPTAWTWNNGNCLYGCLAAYEFLDGWNLVFGQLNNGEGHYAFYCPIRHLIVDPTREYEGVDLVNKTLLSSKKKCSVETSTNTELSVRTTESNVLCTYQYSTKREISEILAKATNDLSHFPEEVHFRMDLDKSVVLSLKGQNEQWNLESLSSNNNSISFEEFEMVLIDYFVNILTPKDGEEGMEFRFRIDKEKAKFSNTLEDTSGLLSLVSIFID